MLTTNTLGGLLLRQNSGVKASSGALSRMALQHQGMMAPVTPEKKKKKRRGLLNEDLEDIKTGVARQAGVSSSELSPLGGLYA